MRDQNPTQHKTAFELEREARIAENKQRLASLGLEGTADALRKTLDQDKATKQAARKKRQQQQQPRLKVAREVRRSERVQKLPAVDYNKDLLVVERLARAELRNANSSGRSVRRVMSRAYDGLSPVLDVRSNPVAAWQAAPAGWKEALGCAGVEAAEAARTAAVVLAERLNSKGRPAFVKSMTFSQVASGFWSAVPHGLGSYYGNSKKDIFMVSDDQAHRTPNSFVKLWRAGDVEDSVRWRVVYLPRPSQDYGWSGGWRSFAIDHMLSPTDTVVFEVMDNAEGEAEVERIKAAAAAAVSAPASAAAGGGDGQEAGRGSSPAGAATSSGASCEGAAASGQEGEGEQQQQQRCQPAAAAAAGSKAGHVYKDNPEKRVYVKAYVFRASAYESKEEMDRRREAAAARAAAAAAEQQKMQQQEKEQQDNEEEEEEMQTEGGEEGAAGASGSRGAAAGDGAAAAAGAGGGEGAGGRGSRKRKSAGDGAGAQQQRQQQEKRSRGKQQAAAGAAAAGPAEAVGARKRQRAQQQQDPQEEEGEAGGASEGKQGGRKKPKAAAPSAPATAAGGKKGAAGAGAAGAGAAGASGAGKQQAQAGWVPQPANPGVLVPPPTADEFRRNETTSDFVVDRIMAHKVVKCKDEFLIRWEGFGAYWDSWESAGCLNAPPHTYTWQGGKAAIPAKFLQKQSKK